MNLKYLSIFFLFSPIFSLDCDQNLLTSYGLEGLTQSQTINLDMCKFVKESCCKVSDQMTIFSNWETSGEHRNLKNRFAYHRDVYSDLLHLLEDASELAHRVVDRLKERRVSNCKVLGKRILHFQVKEISSKLKNALENMHQFFENSYQGFYCTLCDAVSHQYFNSTLSKVTFSQKFCRDITANSLHVLLYFHIHFVKYMNLVSRFIVSCDHKGNFEEKPIDPALNLLVNHHRKEELEECKTHRNEANWFDFCHKLCEEFNIVHFTKFFEPHVKEFSVYNVKLSEELHHIIDEEHKEQEMLLTVGTSSIHRLLAEKNPKEKKKSSSRLLSVVATSTPNPHEEITPERLASLKNEFTNPLIFTSGLNAIEDLSVYKSNFEDPGIDLFDNGKKSMITEALYKSVKSLTKVDSGTSTNRKLAWSALLGVVATFVFGLLA